MSSTSTKLALALLVSAATAKANDMHLHLAVAQGNVKEVKKCITAGDDINAVDANGKTAIEIALDKIETTKFSPIACNHGDQCKIHRKHNKNAQDKANSANRKNISQHCQIINNLIANGAIVDINNPVVWEKIKPVIDNCSKTYIYWNGRRPAVHRKHASVIVNAQDENGQTRLMWAAQNGDYELAKELVNAGANVYVLDYNDKTAITYAANDNKMLSILLKKDFASTVEEALKEETTSKDTE